MANEEQLSILKQGVEVWNKWRVKNLAIHIDLRGPISKEPTLVMPISVEAISA